MKRLTATTMLLGLLVLAGITVAESARRGIDQYMDRPSKRWREGPVRYILTKWEDDEYKALRSEETRARFIENFWRRRDETPGTPGNEFRAEFWKRVRDANRLYGDETAKDGWRTDMGKIHILRGPPDEITRDTFAQGHRGTVIWVYRTSGETGIGPNVVVAFARDVTGEFRLSTEPSKDADPKQGSPLPYQPAMGTNKFAKAQIRRSQQELEALFNLTDPLIRAAGGPMSSTPLSLLSDLVKLQQPLKEWEVRETIATREFFGSVPMRARADFFRTTTDSTLVILTSAVKSSAVHYRLVGGQEKPDVVFYGRIMDLTGNDLVASLESDEAFSAAEENASATLDQDLIFQARVALAPGSYKALLTVLDRAGGRAGSYEFSLTVPDFSQQPLMLSSVMLAKSIAARETGSPASDEDTSAGATTPFVLGNLRILPRLGQTFSPGEDFSFYYQVYGAAPDPASGRPLLDVDYGFYTVSADEIQDLGHVGFENQDRAAHGYALSLKDWPPGPYMLRVSVTDKVSEETAAHDLIFEIR